MCFILRDVPRFENGKYVQATDYDAGERAYVKMRHDLLEIMDNPDIDDAQKGEHGEHMVAYQGLRSSLNESVAQRLMPWVAPDKVTPTPADPDVLYRREQ